MCPVRNARIGGTDWADSDSVSDSDLDDTNNAMVRRYEELDSAAEVTTTSATYETAKSFAITTADGNGLIEAFRLSCEMKNSAASNDLTARVKISGATLGNKYVVITQQQVGAAVDAYSNRVTGTDEGELILDTDPAENNYETYAAMGQILLPLQDVTTTITVQFKTAAGTMTMKNVLLAITYIDEVNDTS